MSLLDFTWKDCADTWRQIYRLGGEPLLKEWSDHMASIGRFWMKSRSSEDHHGIRLLNALREEATCDEEVLENLDLIPLQSRPHFFDGTYCSMKLVALLWHNKDYKDAAGDSEPFRGATAAFFNKHDYAMDVYLTRSDLAAMLPSDLKRLYECAAQKYRINHG